MFALEWSTRSANVHRHKHNSTSTQFLTLPIIVITLLLHYGADPTYMTAASPNDRDWNALHFMISSAHVISYTYLNDELLLEMNRLSQHTLLKPFQPENGAQIDLYKFLSDTHPHGEHAREWRMYKYFTNIVLRYSCIIQ